LEKRNHGHPEPTGAAPDLRGQVFTFYFSGFEANKQGEKENVKTCSQTFPVSDLFCRLTSVSPKIVILSVFAKDLASTATEARCFASLNMTVFSLFRLPAVFFGRVRLDVPSSLFPYAPDPPRKVKCKDLTL